MMFWLRFALRSCLRRRRRTGIILAGVAFAVGALVVLGAIMVGVNDTMIANAAALGSGQVAVAGHAVPMAAAVARAEELRTAAARLGGVRDTLPRCKFPALLKSENATHAVQVRLVRPEVEARVTPVAKRMVAGAYFAGGDGFVIGDAVAAALACTVGDTVTLVTSAERYERRVTGIYHTGINEYDGGLAFAPIASARDFKEPQVEYELAVFLHPATSPEAPRTALDALKQPGETATVWTDTLPEVAQLVDLNRFSMNLMTLIVVVILAFGVSNALLISVMDRYRHLAVLKAIGVRPVEITMMVMFEAAAMCIAAGLVGTLLGGAAAAVWGRVGLDLSHYTSNNPHFCIDPVVRPRLTPLMTLVPQALALSAGVLSAIWPAVVAARRGVSRGMRDL